MEVRLSLTENKKASHQEALKKYAKRMN